LLRIKWLLKLYLTVITSLIITSLTVTIVIRRLRIDITCIVASLNNSMYSLIEYYELTSELTRYVLVLKFTIIIKLLETALK
jgi:hypothetical protein